jgi:hypothetical protein
VSVQDVGNLLLLAAAVPAVLSVLVYARVPWWRTEIGRHLFAYMAIVALLCSLGVVRIVFGPPWFDVLRTTLFAAFPIVTWWRFALIVKEQRETARRARRGRRRADKTHGGPEGDGP